MVYLSYASQDQLWNLPVYSIIAFNTTANISKVKTDDLPQNTFIVSIQQLANTILSISEKQPIKALSGSEITRIYELLRPLTVVSEAEKEKHANSIY